MNEYHQHVGRRVHLRQEHFKIMVSAESCRDSLRKILNPLEKINNLNADNLVALSLSLAGQIEKLQELEKQLLAIQNIIGD